MEILDVLKIDNGIFAYCKGNDITSSMNAKSIIVSNKEFRVGRSELLTSISGDQSLLLELINVKKLEEVPLGTVHYKDNN